MNKARVLRFMSNCYVKADPLSMFKHFELIHLQKGKAAKRPLGDTFLNCDKLVMKRPSASPRCKVAFFVLGKIQRSGEESWENLIRDPVP